MRDINDLERFRSSPVNGVHVATGRIKLGMTVGRNIINISAGGTGYGQRYVL